METIAGKTSPNMSVNYVNHFFFFFTYYLSVLFALDGRVKGGSNGRISNRSLIGLLSASEDFLSDIRLFSFLEAEDFS